MAKSPLGLFAGRVLRSKRTHARWANKYYKRRMLMLDKRANPLGGSPQARGIVLERLELNPSNLTPQFESVSEYNSSKMANL